MSFVHVEVLNSIYLLIKLLYSVLFQIILFKLFLNSTIRRFNKLYFFIINTKLLTYLLSSYSLLFQIVLLKLYSDVCCTIVITNTNTILILSDVLENFTIEIYDLLLKIAYDFV